jgi:PAS domain S-box-containing protein
MRTELTKVLLIEDDPLYAQALKDLITAHRWLFEFELADSLKSGLRRLSEGEIDLVLLDLSLPDSAGMATVRTVRDHSPQTPIIVLTGCDDEEIALQAMQSGAQDYLVKDQIDFQLLRRAMRYAIERQRGELALRESQTKLYLIADSAPEVITLFDLKERKLVYVNRQVQNTLGYSPEQLQQAPLASLAHPDDLAKLVEIYRRAWTLELGEVVEAVYRVKHANGEWRWMSSEITVLIHGEGKGVPQVLSATRDITERKLYEEKLREQAELLNCAQDAILTLDREGRVLFWNKAAERIYGWTAEEVAGTRLDDWVNEEALKKWTEKDAEIKRGLLEHGEWMGELGHFTKDGRPIVVESRCALMRDAEGRPKSVLVINTDITEKKRLEDQFLRMQRLESIGALASGIAHDLNNWLAPIMLSLHTLQQRFTDANSQKWLSLIRKSVERSRDLIDQVLTFAKGAVGERAPLRTSNIVADVAKIVREVVPGDISLDLDLPENLWSVIGDATQVHQVMMNLCINARDAMPGGGKLLITAANQLLDEDDVRANDGVKPGRFVEISVTDTGIGMSPELMDRAFEPFFTTKENGLGSGLGLSTALGIVRSHGGFINVTSAVGKGSQFRVYLPATESKAEGLLEEKEESPPTGHGELILVVDDETEAREVTRATLELSGYRTLGARDGQEALSLYSQHRDEIELVVTNFLLPHQDGVSLGGALRHLNPRLGIIVTSGLHSQEQIEAAKRAGIRTILWKPYTAQQLLKAMANNLT